MLALKEILTVEAGPALTWLAQSYSKPGELDYRAGLQRIGYTKCWDDENFIQLAMHCAVDFLPGFPAAGSEAVHRGGQIGGHLPASHHRLAPSQMLLADAWFGSMPTANSMLKRPPSAPLA